MRYVGVILGLCFVVSTGAFAAEVTEKNETTLLDAITKGSFKLNLRYRYEDVDQDGFDKRGQASTLRTMAGYKTGTWKGLEVYLEFEDIRDLGLSNDHNNAGAGSLWNGVTDRPVIPDAPVTELNQAFLGWSPIKTLPFRFDLQDLSLSVTALLGKFKLLGIYHDFSADTGGFDWGSEIDAAVIYTAPWKQQFAIKYAGYSATDHATDTDKLWIWTSWGF